MAVNLCLGYVDSLEGVCACMGVYVFFCDEQGCQGKCSTPFAILLHFQKYRTNVD